MQSTRQSERIRIKSDKGDIMRNAVRTASFRRDTTEKESRPGTSDNERSPFGVYADRGNSRPRYVQVDTDVALRVQRPRRTGKEMYDVGVTKETENLDGRPQPRQNIAWTIPAGDESTPRTIIPVAAQPNHGSRDSSPIVYASEGDESDDSQQSRPERANHRRRGQSLIRAWASGRHLAVQRISRTLTG